MERKIEMTGMHGKSGGRGGGSGTHSSTKEFVTQNSGNLRKLDDCLSPNAFKTLEEVELYLGGNTIVCLECGNDYKSLANHINRSHNGLSPIDYRAKYNIPYGRPLISRTEFERMSRVMVNRLKDFDEKKKLIENGRKGADVVRGQKSKRKNSVLKNNRSERCKKAQKEWSIRRHSKVRPEWIDILNNAIERRCRLHELCTVTSRKIQEWIRRHPEDDEIVGLYKKLQAALLPTGVRLLPSGRYRSVTWCVDRKKYIGHGTFDTKEEAQIAQEYKI